MVKLPSSLLDRVAGALTHQMQQYKMIELASQDSGDSNDDILDSCDVEQFENIPSFAIMLSVGLIIFSIGAFKLF